MANTLDPDPRSRELFTFHGPKTLILGAYGFSGVQVASGAFQKPKPDYDGVSTLPRRRRQMPLLDI